MNDSNSDLKSANCSTCAFLPLTLLALSIALILSWEVYNATSQRSLFTQGIAQRDEAVKQSRQVQSGLEKLVMDLVDAAKDDDDAKKIIAKYNIQISGKPASSEAAAPSPAK